MTIETFERARDIADALYDAERMLHMLDGSEKANIQCRGKSSNIDGILLDDFRKFLKAEIELLKDEIERL